MSLLYESMMEKQRKEIEQLRAMVAEQQSLLSAARIMFEQINILSIPYPGSDAIMIRKIANEGMISIAAPQQEQEGESHE